MNKIEERNSEKYTRIENLNPYEFTNCVAYELQMRKQNRESEIIYNETNGYILHGISISEIKITNKINLKDLIYQIFPSLYDDAKNLIKKKEPAISDEKLEKTIKDANIDIKDIILNYIKNETIVFNEVFYENNDKMEKLTKAKLIEIINKTSFAPNITPNFSVPPTYQKHHKYVTLHSINLELPEKDLVEYIKKIKKDYDTNKLNIKMPVDLISDNFKENNELCTQREYENKKYKKIKIEKKTGNSIVKQSKIVFNSAKKVADMLYIYDQTKRSFTMKEIRPLLTDYYESEFTYDTYYFYEAVAKEFIDNNGYLELVSKPL
jgi:hypothetical protein